MYQSTDNRRMLISVKNFYINLGRLCSSRIFHSVLECKLEKMIHRGVENYLKEVSACDFIVVSGSDEFQEQGKKKCKALQTKISM